MKMNPIKIAALLAAFIVGWFTYGFYNLHNDAKHCSDNGDIFMKQYGHDWQCISLIKD
jgi:hypothetical protein